MKTTYTAAQVSQTGLLELVERPIPTPRTGEVLLALEACGICGADMMTVENINADFFPRVPGHEVVGRIIALPEHTLGSWEIGQRVGVGRLGGHCNQCSECRQGLFNLCNQQPIIGSTHDGGYAEMMIAKETGLVAIPDELSSVEAAPLLCAGIATFNALKKSGAQAGDLVAIFGIGGLGHLAIQYAKKMGFKVVAIGRGQDIAEQSTKLGAHIYINTDLENAVEKLQHLGKAQVILSTITNGEITSNLFAGLAPHGKLMIVGVGKEPLTIPTPSLVGGERSVQGAITGTPYEIERTLDFSVLTNTRAMIETYPLEQVQEAYLKMKSGQAQFRIVLTM
ncbi:alcohol dehydrogenase catalytic domain-containing protein [Acinetobacter baumannii]|nr:alcohol dehydrogenase catalytic domain-containing protein [Acinetobacter baumannii]MDV7413972.1 alcohol dehydrogenase catalytic domain-containing protein [Acinetobacter baumannii]MDV7456862.1 alcohol dehydrogenase catalytic domain-containing protein [Acinetobacter baumannii]